MSHSRFCFSENQTIRENLERFYEEVVKNIPRELKDRSAIFDLTSQGNYKIAFYSLCLVVLNFFPLTTLIFMIAYNVFSILSITFIEQRFNKILENHRDIQYKFVNPFKSAASSTVEEDESLDYSLPLFISVNSINNKNVVERGHLIHDYNIVILVCIIGILLYPQSVVLWSVFTLFATIREIKINTVIRRNIEKIRQIFED